MANSGTAQKKKIKQVNGWRVNHPYQGSNIVFAIFILILAALPVGIFFLPILRFVDPSVAAPDNVVASMTGLDLFKYFFVDFMKAMSSATFSSFEQAMQYSISYTMSDNTMPDALKMLLDSCPDAQSRTILFFVAYFQALLLAFLILNSVILIIYFIINISKGYLRHARHIKVISLFNFLWSLLFSLSFLVYFFTLMINGKSNTIYIWLGLIPAGGALLFHIIISAMYNGIYRDVVYENDLEYHEDERKEEVAQVTEIKEVTKVNYEPANTIPQNITSIGGHDFAENQNLEIANIPLGISKIGNSAFANCLKLKVVSIPESVKEIGYNCFFNCASLARINYAGTKEQWRHVKRGSNWLAKAKTSEVVCVDGPVVVNPYH